MWRKKKSLSFLPPWEFQTPLSLGTPRLLINLPRKWLSQYEMLCREKEEINFSVEEIFNAVEKEHPLVGRKTVPLRGDGVLHTHWMSRGPVRVEKVKYVFRKGRKRAWERHPPDTFQRQSPNFTIFSIFRGMFVTISGKPSNIVTYWQAMQTSQVYYSFPH